MNTITLRRESNCWTATWAGPRAEEIKSLFGTATIPTAFTASAAPDVVLAAVKKLNPEHLVLLA